MSLPLVTVQMLRGFNPSYDVATYLPENWEGDALGMLAQTQVPAKDRLWTVLRTAFLPEYLLRLFAVECARSIRKNVDALSLQVFDDTLEVATRFANGEATNKELETAATAASHYAHAAPRSSAAASAAYFASYSTCLDATQAASFAYSAASETEYAQFVDTLVTLINAEVTP